MSASLIETWNRTVHSRPDAPALIDASDGRAWSRRALDAHAAAWADAAALPLAGEGVAFSEPNGPAWLQVFLGLLKAGAVPAPLDPGEPAEAQRYLAQAIRARFLWSSGTLHRIHRGRRAPEDGRRVLKITSGSTGTPRALPFTDFQLLADARQICATMGIRPTDINLGLIPFGHSYGLGNLVLPLLAQGTTIVSGIPALPQALAAGIAKWLPTVFPAVPTLVWALAEADVEPKKLSSLRTVVSAGSELPPQAARSFYRRFGLKIHSFYGSSETGGITYDRSGDAALTGRSVGTPLKDVRLTFGRGGRFTVASAAVFTLGNPCTSRGRGVHLVSDLGRLDSHGELALLGRAGRTIKVAGRRFNPAEIEGILKKLPGVGDAFVAADPHRPHALAAAVAGTVSADAIRTALRGKVAPWKIPGRLIALPRLPVTARGKPDTRRLLALLEG
jgi:acyl-coenzyme A synthetase/AMP-(fatty) acid ligase